MALNPPGAYGLDLGCYQDADSSWSSVTGIDLVRQDSFHRVTTTNVLGPGGNSWGRDARELLGMPAHLVARQAPAYVDVLTRDERVLSAAVTLTPITYPDGTADVEFSAECMTDEGPFSLVFPVSALTNEKIEQQGVAA